MKKALLAFTTAACLSLALGGAASADQYYATIGISPYAHLAPHVSAGTHIYAHAGPVYHRRAWRPRTRAQVVYHAPVHPYYYAAYPYYYPYYQPHFHVGFRTRDFRFGFGW